MRWLGSPQQTESLDTQVGFLLRAASHRCNPCSDHANTWFEPPPDSVLLVGHQKSPTGSRCVCCALGEWLQSSDFAGVWKADVPDAVGWLSYPLMMTKVCGEIVLKAVKTAPCGCEPGTGRYTQNSAKTAENRRIWAGSRIFECLKRVSVNSVDLYQIGIHGAGRVASVSLAAWTGYRSCAKNRPVLAKKLGWTARGGWWNTPREWYKPPPDDGFAPTADALPETFARLVR